MQWGDEVGRHAAGGPKLRYVRKAHCLEAILSGHHFQETARQEVTMQVHCCVQEGQRFQGLRGGENGIREFHY